MNRVLSLPYLSIEDDLELRSIAPFTDNTLSYVKSGSCQIYNSKSLSLGCLSRNTISIKQEKIYKIIPNDLDKHNERRYYFEKSPRNSIRDQHLMGIGTKKKYQSCYRAYKRDTGNVSIECNRDGGDVLDEVYPQDPIRVKMMGKSNKNHDITPFTSEQDKDKYHKKTNTISWLKPELIFNSSSIVEKELIGKGEYGLVKRGLYKHGNAVFSVAIKSLTSKDGDVDHASMIGLLDEAKTMVSLGGYHENIVNLQGLMLEGEVHLPKKVSLVLEFCLNGDIRSFLIKHTKEFQKGINANHENRNIEITDWNNVKKDLSLLIVWAFQIALGMEFLASKNIYHGDLAARNILLTGNIVAKISDFGCSKRLYSNVSKCLYKDLEDENDIELPLKWAAIEVLQYGTFSTKSDVWSFGVLLWEIFQLGEQPYHPRVTFNSLKKELIQGNRLDDPIYAPQPIKKLCRNCWNEIPEDRPRFTNIIDFIKHNFKIKTNMHQNNTRANNSCSLTYAKLHFSGIKAKNQFDIIQKSLPFNKTLLKDCDRHDGIKRTYSCIDIGESTKMLHQHQVSQSVRYIQGESEPKDSATETFYKKIDPVRSRALMACQLDLELESMLENESISYEFNQVPRDLQSADDEANSIRPWYRRERHFVNTKLIIIVALCVLVFVIVVHVIYFHFEA